MEIVEGSHVMVFVLLYCQFCLSIKWLKFITALSVDVPDDTAVKGVEELSFTAVATSVNNLYTVDNVKIRQCSMYV